MIRSANAMLAGGEKCLGAAGAFGFRIDNAKPKMWIKMIFSHKSRARRGREGSRAENFQFYKSPIRMFLQMK